MPTTVIVRAEPASDVYAEALPLFRKHWEEISHYHDIPLDIDLDAYLAQELAGSLRCFAARIDGALVGYAVYFVRYNLRYRSSLQAAQDVLFVLPEHRKGRVGLKLIRSSEEALRAEGVQIVYQHSKASRPEGTLFERLGYELVDLIHAKRLDQERS